jgi:glycosyltransferase involved in cell wall biosynthesis
MPGVLIEAGLSALPVVATAVPGVYDIVVDEITGLVVPVDDLDAMVRATARLVEDPVLRAHMGEGARRHCGERFTLDLVAERWLSFLEPLVARSVSGGAARNARGARPARGG